MSAPVLPIEPDIFRANVAFRDFKGGETLAPAPGIVIRTIPLNHPNGATGYRIEHGGRAACYLTDLEHTGEAPDPALRGDDVVVVNRNTARATLRDSLFRDILDTINPFSATYRNAVTP